MITDDTMTEIPKTYDPQQAEHSHYARWEREGYFAPEINKDPNAPVFSIAIPPPNVTGSLHMGHALQHTMMDVLARHKRMCGYRTLWLPGMDHAGISTQLVVSRQLKKEKLSRHDLGREKFVERVWQWKAESGGEITKQMRREGASVDWSRERFTMDEGLSRAVREVFVRLYEEGHIYRGARIVNWCPTDQTVLSDLEVEKAPHKDKLYYLQYPLKDSARRITVATTRPETMLGDTAVAVNPDDERFRDLVGQMVLLPLTGRTIPVIADDYVDPAFGTGAVKITPAHDANDYEMGVRHSLPQVFVIDQNARMTLEAGEDFAGLDRFKARERVVEQFQELGLLEKIDEYEFSISRCERCRTVIEPLISTQWFVRMEEVRDLALDLKNKEGKPRFIPETYEKVYTNWLENLRDWTISRQLWWGHQIPAWYDEAGNVYVARDEAEARAKAGTDQLTQDPDVLDTWFSSALWPFSTLGWPEQTEDLKTFYPTSVLVTARDIIFLWVSRMVMMGLKFASDRPFDDVFVTGTILDKHGQRMSKTKMNGVDPLEVFDKYGVDATRIMLAAVGTTDVRWNDKQVESYRNFANKIWNATRFCLMNVEGAESSGDPFANNQTELPLHDRWILSRLHKTARDMNAALGAYAFHEAVQLIYHFFWDDFCDWYIELTKAIITAAEESPERSVARARMIWVLEQSLRLLHPFMPYITEELWQRLPVRHQDLLHPAYANAPPTIMLASYPQSDAGLIDERAEVEMQAVIDLVTRVRNIRSEMNIKPGDRVPVLIGAADDQLRAAFAANSDQIARLARASSVSVSGRLTAPRASARAALAGGAELAVPLEGLIDFEQERARLHRDRDKLEAEATKLEAQLANPQFVERAPAEKVSEARAKIADIQQRMAVLAETIEGLK
ncbi:MAG: valyl-tRNA synthetase [Blastocatellia bacterium]|jgi:valyl-tRNA synthetase|nr:valyl-tRNA synthetase [Blastocatellia bacterium]